MNARDVIPTVMVRNEERFIAQVLRPLTTVFPIVLVGDTGSTDQTRAIATTLPNVRLIEYGPQAHPDLTKVRQDLGLRAYDLGAPWQLLCDGDELYTVATLRYLLAQDVPTWMEIGFVTMLTIDEDEATGQCWELDDVFSRTAWLKSDVVWTGDYPFDVPISFGKPERFFYHSLPDGFRYAAVHLHPLRRSSADAVVALREYKRKKFSMQDHHVPRVRPFDLTAWCAL